MYAYDQKLYCLGQKPFAHLHKSTQHMLNCIKDDHENDDVRIRINYIYVNILTCAYDLYKIKN